MTHNEALIALRDAWIERRDAIGLKGKKADHYCLEYVCGAATAMTLLDKGFDFRGLVFLVSVRGQSALIECK